MDSSVVAQAQRVIFMISESSLRFAGGSDRQFDFYGSFVFETLDLAFRKAEQPLQHHRGMFAKAGIRRGIGAWGFTQLKRRHLGMPLTDFLMVYKTPETAVSQL